MEKELIKKCKEAAMLGKDVVDDALVVPFNSAALLIQMALSQQKEEMVNEAHNLVSGLHVKARKSYASDSWDAGYHDALFAVEKLLVTLIKNQ